MRISAFFAVLASLTPSLACSGSDRPLEPAAGLASAGAGAGNPAVRAPQAVPNAGAPTNLDAAAPLTDDELDRLLDALEQQLDKK